MSPLSDFPRPPIVWVSPLMSALHAELLTSTKESHLEFWITPSDAPAALAMLDALDQGSERVHPFSSVFFPNAYFHVLRDVVGRLSRYFDRFRGALDIDALTQETCEVLATRLCHRVRANAQDSFRVRNLSYPFPGDPQNFGDLSVGETLSCHPSHGVSFHFASFWTANHIILPLVLALDLPSADALPAEVGRRHRTDKLHYGFGTNIEHMVLVCQELADRGESRDAAGRRAP
jgi:hypothetical protein